MTGLHRRKFSLIVAVVLLVAAWQASADTSTSVTSQGRQVGSSVSPARNALMLDAAESNDTDVYSAVARRVPAAAVQMPESVSLLLLGAGLAFAARTLKRQSGD